MSAEIQHSGTIKEGEVEVDDMAPMPPLIDKVLDYDKASLDDARLNNDKIFVKLWENLRRFTVEADEHMKMGTTN